VKGRDLKTEVNLGRGLVLPNPVLVASGTFGYGTEYLQYVELSQLGGIVVKTLTLEPRSGNPGPRIVETPAGMLNAIGLQNIGIEAFLREQLPEIQTYGVPIIANIYGESTQEFVELAERLSSADGVSGIELNLSCPNIEHGETGAAGLMVAQDPSAVTRVVDAVRRSTELPVIAKLSPNVTSVQLIARSAVDAGADAISLINTLHGMVVDIETRKPRLANVTGGLSGPAVRPVAIRMVWETANVVDIPVIGIGGITSAADAVEFMIAGAHAVAIGSATFRNPRAALDVIDGIRDYMADHDIGDINHLVGSIES